MAEVQFSDFAPRGPPPPRPPGRPTELAPPRNQTLVTVDQTPATEVHTSAYLREVSRGASSSGKVSSAVKIGLIALVVVAVVVAVAVGVAFGTGAIGGGSSTNGVDGSSSAGLNGGAGASGGPAVRPTGKNFDDSAPASITLMDYTNEDAPVAAGTIAFDLQVEDLIFDHPWLDQSIGATSVVHCKKTIVWGEFEFGAMFTAQSAHLNAEGNFPVYQLMVAAKPYGRWSKYPNRRTWNDATDVTHPPAFKILIHDAKKNLIGTIQLHDGLPVNSKMISHRGRGPPGQPLREWWHIGQMLKWQNAYHKPNQNMRKWIGGFTPDSIRHSQAKTHFSVNPAQVTLSQGGSDMRTQYNGINHWFALPKWPLGASSSTGYGDASYDPTGDPFMPNFWQWTGSVRPNSAHGWGYDPGSPGGHDHLTGPGGQRSDRACIATPYAIFYADENFRRLKENVTIREAVEHWGNNYFNHGGYWTTNLTNFASLPMKEVHATRWAFSRPYYGSQLNEVPQGDKTAWDYNVELRVAFQGSYDGGYPAGYNAQNYYHDRDGELFWNGWGIDNHHSYQFGGWHTLMFSSAVHLFAMRAGYTWNVLSFLSSRNIAVPGSFMYRVHAFRWAHMVHAWIMSNSHSTFGMNRTEIEIRFHTDCENIVNILMAKQTNPTAMTDLAMARFGSYLADDRAQTINGVPSKQMILTQSSLGYYITPALAMMKTSGMWDKLRQNPTTKKALDWVIDRYDTYCFGKIVYGKERMAWGGSANVTDYVPTSHVWTAADLPASWEDWARRYPSTQGPAETMVQNDDGTFKTGNNEYAASHVEVSYAFMRRDYFPEIAHPLLNQACQLFQQAYDAVAKNVAAKPISQRRDSDWIYRFPSLGFLSPPTVPV